MGMSLTTSSESDVLFSVQQLYTPPIKFLEIGFFVVFLDFFLIFF